MSVVAFLASVVNPGVAASAAKAALKEITLQKSRIFEEPNSNNNNASASAKERLEQAASLALASAAAKARTIAEIEERRVQRFVGVIVETQLKKLELKLAHFEELENYLENEKKEIEKQRQELFTARLNIRRQWLALADENSATAVNNATSNGNAVQMTTSPNGDNDNTGSTFTNL